LSVYIFTKRAVLDITDIWNYTFENWSEEQADNYYRQIILECERLAENPLVGRKYGFMIGSLRGSNISKHIIFYRILEQQTIEVERILHERVDMKNIFKS